MSTRCQIGFYEANEQPVNAPDVVIYRHCDGFPGASYGVVAQLMPILRRFHEIDRLRDVEYVSARVLAHLIQVTDPLSLFGYGICGHRSLHGDVKYYYRVSPSGLIVYDVGRGDGWNRLRWLEFHTFA